MDRELGNKPGVPGIENFVEVDSLLAEHAPQRFFVVRVTHALVIHFVECLPDWSDFAVEKLAECGAYAIWIIDATENQGIDPAAIHEQDFGGELQVGGERLRHVEVIEVFALEPADLGGSVPIAAEGAIKSVAAAAAEFGVGAGTLFDSLIEDDAAERGFHRSTAGAANVQIEHCIVSRAVSGMVELRSHFQRWIMRVKDGARPDEIGR